MGTKGQREVWLSRELEPRQLHVYARPEKEELKVQICAGAGRGYGLSTTVSLGLSPRGGSGRQEGPARISQRCPKGANLEQRAPSAGRPTSQESRNEVGQELLKFPNSPPY